MVSGIRRARFILGAPVLLAEVNQNVVLLCPKTAGSIHSLRAPTMLRAAAVSCPPGSRGLLSASASVLLLPASCTDVYLSASVSVLLLPASD
jgi:hypothetical protein